MGKWIAEALLYADEVLNLQLQVTVLTRSVHHVLLEMPHWRERNSLHLVEGDVSNWNPRRVREITHIILGLIIPTRVKRTGRTSIWRRLTKARVACWRWRKGSNARHSCCFHLGQCMASVKKLILRHWQSRKATVMTIYESPMSISLQIF